MGQVNASDLVFGMDWSSFDSHFGSLEDFRNAPQVVYPLREILFLTLVGVVCDCEGWEELEDFGEDELDWLRQYYLYEKGIPSHFTLERVISSLCSQSFEHAFCSWVGSLPQLSGVQINIDGKTLRGSRNEFMDTPAVHLVNAWCSASGLSLGQVKTETKSNEITAIPQLLSMLELAGNMISIDAMGCQRAIAEQILEARGDYFLAVKDNQPTLRQGLEQSFLRLSPEEVDQTLEKNRGRIEQRKATVLTDLSWLECQEQWKGIQSLVRIQSQRKVISCGKNEQHVRYYICSAHLNAKRANQLARGHWAIENQLHWSLDVIWQEDNSRKRTRNAAQNMALFRKIALNILRNEPSKGSIKRKRKRASRNRKFRNGIFYKMEVL